MSETTPTEDTLKNCSWYGWVLIAVGALLRIVSFFFSANSGGDALERLALTAEWLKHPVFKVGYGAYPPGHFWLIALFTLIFHDVVFAGRFLSLVTGIASLYLVWRLARNLYGEPSGVLALAVFAFYSLHIGYSTTSSAEVSYLFFLLAGLMLFFGYFRDESRPLGRLALGGLSLSVAESIRLEGWAIFFGLGIILVFLEYQDHASQAGWFPRCLKPVLTLGLTAGAWPIFSMVYSAIVFHDPMWVLSQHNTAVTGWFKAHPVPLGYQLALGPGAMLMSLSLLAVPAALYGWWKSWGALLASSFAALTAFFLVVQNYEIATGKLLAMARYTLIPGTMLAVLSGYGLQRICEKLFANRIGLVHSAILGLLFLNVVAVLAMSELPNRYAETFASISPRLRYQERIRAVGEYLRSHMGPNDALVIDDYNVESSIVANAAGLPLIPGKRAYLLSKKNTVTVADYINTEHPRFLVYAERGTLQHWFQLPPGCMGTVEVNGVMFYCTFAGPTYRVYELHYQ